MGRKKIYTSEQVKEFAQRHSQYYNRRLQSLRAGIEFSIRFNDVVWPTHCPILGIELIRSTENRNSSPRFDRINPELGYVTGNVRVISKLANVMKNNASREEIETFIRNIIPYLDGEL